MSETIVDTLNDTVNAAESYAHAAASATGLSVFVICLLTVAAAIVAYRIFKNVASVLVSLFICFVIIVMCRSMGLF